MRGRLLRPLDLPPSCLKSICSKHIALATIHCALPISKSAHSIHLFSISTNLSTSHYKETFKPHLANPPDVPFRCSCAVPVPASVLPNTTLGQDKATVLMLWKGWGGAEEVLRRGHEEASNVDEVDVDYEWDEVVKWKGFNEGDDLDDLLKWGGFCRWEGGYGAGLDYQGPTWHHASWYLGNICLTWQNHYRNNMSGTLPPELSNLAFLSLLFLNNNFFLGAVSSSLSELTNLHSISLPCHQLLQHQRSTFQRQLRQGMSSELPRQAQNQDRKRT